MIMEDYGAGHWSSKKVWDRRKNQKLPIDNNSDNNRKVRKVRDNTTPYDIHFRLGDEEMEWLDSVRNHLTDADGDINWHNNSMLLRRVIKLAYIYVETMRDQKTLEIFQEKED